MSQENVEVVRRTMDAYNARDLPAYFDMLSESVSLQSRFSAMGHVYHGHDDLRRYFAELDEVWSRYEMRVLRLVPAGRLVAALCHLYAVGRESDLQVEENSAIVFTLEAGKIVRIDAYPTHAQALEAAGVSEQPMSQENVVLAREVVSAFNRRDVPALVELTTDDFEWVTWTGTVEPTVYHGADGLAGYFRDSDVWEILTLDVEEFRDLGDKLIVVGVFHARGGESGVEVHEPYYSAFFARQGKLERVLSFRTERQALEAVGLSE